MLYLRSYRKYEKKVIKIISLDNFIDLIEDLPYSSEYDLDKTIEEIGIENLVKEIYKVLYNYKIMNFDFADCTYRVKAVDSVLNKIKKFYGRNIPAYKVCSDLLAFRIIVPNYNIDYTNTRIDCKHVSKNGYNAVHFYYRKTKYTYPIEIVCMTKSDEKFNTWLDTYVYGKYDSIGDKLRAAYDCGTIETVMDFTKEFNNLTANLKKE